ncbi:MAG: T9SS type A sorting domain-containing protein, partial [Bacteroidetes bacterium]|nr:T9SS type A sorting domain-containing protein [Bacteroidota bacterium]
LPSKWAFPDTSIQPMSFLIIWADEDLNQNGLHANFRLSNNGEFLSLAYADGTILDSVSFGIQDNDTTFGRFPNGTGSFGLMYPTFGKSNGFFTAIDTDLSESSARIYPNPTLGQVFIEFPLPGEHLIRVISVAGQELGQYEALNQSQIELQLYELPPGIYFIQIDGGRYQKIVLGK